MKRNTPMFLSMFNRYFENSTLQIYIVYIATTFNPNSKIVFPLIETAFKPLQQSYEQKNISKILS